MENPRHLSEEATDRGVLPTKACIRRLRSLRDRLKLVATASSIGTYDRTESDLTTSRAERIGLAGSNMTRVSVCVPSLPLDSPLEHKEDARGKLVVGGGTRGRPPGMEDALDAWRREREARGRDRGRSRSNTTT